MKKRALIHVENTQNLGELADYLYKSGWELISANKTETFLRNLNIPVIHEDALEQTTKTNSGYSLVEQQILSVQPSQSVFDGNSSLAHLSETNHENEISLVCINFRPVLQTIAQEHQFTALQRPANFFVTSILRTAYYNSENILILTDPEDYREAILQLMTDSISAEFRTYLAAKALNMVSAYDSGIACSILHSPQFSNNFLNYLTVPYTKHALYNGSNRQQQACLYSLPVENGAVCGLKKISTENIDFNTICDISMAWEFISTLYTTMKGQFNVKTINADGYDFTTQFTPLTGTVFTIAIKFHSILGASLSTNALDSIIKTNNFEKDIDGVSLGCSSVIDEDAAKEIVKCNYQAIIAPSFTEKASEILSQKPNLKLIPTSKVITTDFEGKLVNGGILVQTKDSRLFDQWNIKTRSRPDQQIADEMAFGNLLTLGARSFNAILLKENHIVTVAQSCTTTKKALDQLCIPITDFGKNGELLVCDSPLPYCDSLRYIIDNGLKAIIQPGGAETDDELIKYCNDHNVVMIFTDMTHINF